MVTELSQSDLDYIQTVLDSGQNLYRAYDRISEVAGSSLSSAQRFWFEQASIINQQANGISPDPQNNQSATFILSYTDYGLAIDGLSADLQNTSNAIANNVLQDVLNSGGVPILDDMLANDINAALQVGGQTIAGWGGSFYYWDLEYRTETNPITGQTQTFTVGDDILSDPAELEKLITSAVVGTIGTFSQNQLDGGQTWGEFFEQGVSGLFADAPAWVKEEIIARLIIAQETGDLSTLTSTSNLVPSYRDADGNQWFYAAGDDQFYDPITGEIASGSSEEFLRGRLEARAEITAAGIGNIAQAFISIGRPELIPEAFQCFSPDTLIDMWPLDSDLHPGPDGIYDQELVQSLIWQKPIEEVEVGDVVVSFDKNGNMVPGSVPRVFRNDAKILLNFHGTHVTPGHVYYRPDSKTAHKFETLIDVLRDDGVIQLRDRTLVRAATNVPVGDPRDGFVVAITGSRRADGSVVVKDQGRIRLGTRFIVEGKRTYAVADLIEAGGGTVGEDGLIRVGDGDPMPFHWEFGEMLPNPEDYILACSGVTLEDIYKAGEWEDQPPQMPAPMVLDGGPVQPLSASAREAMPRNAPLSLDGATSERTSLNRKQRKALEAQAKKTSKTRLLN